MVSLNGIDGFLSMGMSVLKEHTDRIYVLGCSPCSRLYFKRDYWSGREFGERLPLRIAHLQVASYTGLCAEGSTDT